MSRDHARSLIFALFLLPVGLLSACESDESPAPEPVVPETFSLEVDHYKVPCEGVARQLCYRVRHVGDVEWHLEYDGVVGLTYVWGHRYVIEAREETVLDPPADGTSVRLLLDELVTDEPVAAGLPFELQVTGEDLQPAANDADYVLLGERRVYCGSDVVCTVLQTRIARGQSADVSFSHDADGLYAFRVN